MLGSSFTSDHLTFVDLSLSRIRSFLVKIENPQDKIQNIIHVAGTNGKGSTCAFLRSILEGHGYSVNVFTSPHLLNYNERFRLSGQLISDDYLHNIKSKLQQIEGYKELTIFELTMVIGFVAFYEQSADFNIIEVGLGGRLDASNVIQNPLLSIITTIDFDHTNFLGNTLEQIAYEKAGIIKRNSKVITDYQKSEVLKIIKKQSSKMEAKLIAGDVDYKVILESTDKEFKKENKNDNNAVLSYNNQHIVLNKISLKGQHQYYNASLAIVACINILKEKFDYTNISSMIANAEWRGRLQQVKHLYGVDFKNSQVYLDGAHNVSGFRVLCNFLESEYGNYSSQEDKKDDFKISLMEIHIFLGMLENKDLNGVFRALYVVNKKFNITIYPIDIEGHSSYSAQDIANIAKIHDFKVVMFDDIAKSLFDIDNNNKKNVIVFCGSLYLLGKFFGDNSL